MAAKPPTTLRTAAKNRALSAPGLANSRSPAHTCSLPHSLTSAGAGRADGGRRRRDQDQGGFCHKARLYHMSQDVQSVCTSLYVTFIITPKLMIHAMAQCDAVVLFLLKHGHPAWQS